MFSKTLFSAVAIAALMTDYDVQAIQIAVESEAQAEAMGNRNRNRDGGGGGGGTTTVTPTSPTQTGFFSGAVWQAKTKEQKMADLWGQINPNPNTVQSPSPYFWSHFDNIFTQRAKDSFDQVMDEMPAGRVKTAHTQGVHAKIQWESTGDHPYTGMYNGHDQAILRMSETSMLTEASDGLLPSLAIKFLVDGRQSENVFGMPNFTGTGQWNFFQEPFRSRVDAFDPIENRIEVATIQKKLIEGNKWPFITGISGVAKTTTNGSQLANSSVIVPYELIFESPFQFSQDKEFDANGEEVLFYDQMKRDINQGDVVLHAYALTAPIPLGGQKVKIADLRLLTPLVTSPFGDARLFFQHETTKNDRELWPGEWRRLDEDPIFDPRDPNQIWGRTVPGAPNNWPETDQAARDKFIFNQVEFGCPFAWLLPEFFQN